MLLKLPDTPVRDSFLDKIDVLRRKARDIFVDRPRKANSHQSIANYVCSLLDKAERSRNSICHPNHRLNDNIFSTNLAWNPS